MARSQAIDWVFFDVGNVLLDESRWLAGYAGMTFGQLRKLAPEIRRADFDAETWLYSTMHDTPAVQRLLRSSDPGAQLPDDFWEPVIHAYFDLGEPPQGACAVIEALARRYRLGVIANQDTLVHAWMERTGLVRWFGVEVYDCDLGFGKPDPRMFHVALQRAECPPERAVMIGDRLDYDIRPARAFGMHAIRVRAGGKYAANEPADAAEIPDADVWSFAEIPDAVDRLAKDM